MRKCCEFHIKYTTIFRIVLFSFANSNRIRHKTLMFLSIFLIKKKKKTFRYCEKIGFKICVQKNNKSKNTIRCFVGSDHSVSIRSSDKTSNFPPLSNSNRIRHKTLMFLSFFFFSKKKKLSAYYAISNNFVPS